MSEQILAGVLVSVCILKRARVFAKCSAGFASEAVGWGGGRQGPLLAVCVCVCVVFYSDHEAQQLLGDMHWRKIRKGLAAEAVSLALQSACEGTVCSAESGA